LGSCHAEGVLVFLTDAVVDLGAGPVAYTGNDGGFGYFVGIAGNNEAIDGFSEAQKEAIRDGFASDFGVVGRVFYNNETELDPSPNSTRATTLFYLPDEVVYAAGVLLVDITGYLANYDPEAGNSGTYFTPGGSLFTYTGKTTDISDLLMGDKVLYTSSPSIGRNTDGFDLDAIEVYK